MKYLIVQDWESTHGNHAGMKHMCDLLSQIYPSEYKTIVNPAPYRYPHDTITEKIINKIKKIRDQKLTYPRQYLNLCKPWIDELNEHDEVFLLEYLYPEVPQYQLAKYIKKKTPLVKVYALAHLTPLLFDTLFKNPQRLITKWMKPVDKLLTLGTSLSLYMQNKKVAKDKISTGFHYVDTNYYKKSESTHFLNDSKLKVIAMGNLQRDFSLLSSIARKTPFIEWTICKGQKQVDDLFSSMQNVKLLGYIEEDSLKEEMEKADLSLNVLEDTVGSNVITTSIAMGLGIIVSDVGSIHDYCNDGNAIFCQNNTDSFVNALQELSQNPSRVMNMKQESLKIKERFDIIYIHKWFSSL